MTLTIIGSMSRSDEMDEIKKVFEGFGYTVNSPNDPYLQAKPLVEIQKEWIRKIEEADLIAVVPKQVSLTGYGGSKFTLEIGESTSYEMAIASRFGKPTIYA